MTDNRTIELLRKLLEERDVEYEESQDCFRTRFRFNYCEACGDYLNEIEVMGACITVSKSYLTPDQAIAATLGRPKAKSHPYGYERDTGCYDCTRCECGCINDISARYCNDCGGEIEVDESAEKEYYDGYSKHTVFAKKHDDGSLEFCERRYVLEDAATLGSEPPYDELLRCLENDWHISARWDGLRKFWCIELTEEGVKLRDATHGTLTAEQVCEVVEKHWHDLPDEYDMPEATALPEYSYDWQAIADELNDMLGSDNEYEAKMDELLCYLTNGKFSKSRQYSLDFMKACVDEEYEDAYNELNAELGSGKAKDLLLRTFGLAQMMHDCWLEECKAGDNVDISACNAYSYEFDQIAQAMFDMGTDPNDSDYCRSAELGSETCELDYDRHCSNCGVCVHESAVLVRKELDGGLWTVVSKPASFCPNCGARIRKAVKR